jgi:hypothetical protein
VTARLAPRHRRPAEAAGAGGNQRLTAMTGAILLAGFAVEGFTVLEVRRLLWLHFALGLLLIGPVVLKICSTCYRFARYYTRAAAYVHRGPPAPLLRVLGPLVILSSVAVLGTGVILALTGPGNGPWLFLHKVSFICWFGVMTIHVLNYAPRLPRLLLARSRPAIPGASTFAVPGGAVRWLLLVLSLAAGVGIAAVTMHLSAGWSVS